MTELLQQTSLSLTEGQDTCNLQPLNDTQYSTYILVDK